MNIRVRVTLFGQLVDGIKRMDVCLCFSYFTLVCSHAVLFRVMNQFEDAQHGYLQQLRVALTVHNVNDVDKYGWTALHFATRRGHADCVNYCIEMGANINARARGGSTPLHFVSYGNVMLFMYCWTRVHVLTQQMMMDGHHSIVLCTTNMLVLHNYSWIGERNCQT
jgi:hypothetical protein